jgi:hypothetical protein
MGMWTIFRVVITSSKNLHTSSFRCTQWASKIVATLTVIGSAVTSRRGDPVAARLNMRQRNAGLSTCDRSIMLLKVPAASAKWVGQGIPCPFKKSVNKVS